MMLHDNIIPGQFLLDVKNECTTKLDIYSPYNFHYHHQQQQRLTSPASEGEVLDLSRRCDSVETRKTPSPYNSISSFSTASPSTHCGSPPNTIQTPTSKSTPASFKPNKLVFPQANPASLPQGIASLYPMYYSNVKQENSLPSSPPSIIPNPFPHSQNANLPQVFNKSPSPKQEEQTCTSSSSLATDSTSILYPSILNAATTGTINSGKTTRPFNAYPRDPLLVAAHFAASDVLWDKTTMERYSTYRKRALDDLRDTNGGHRVITNPKMRRNNINRSGQHSESDERAVESSDNDSTMGNGSRVDHSNQNDTNNNSENSETAMNNGGGIKDEAYYERRRKNNAAAKKSRDRRRIKEDEIAIRAAYLERQNIELLCQIDALKKQLEVYASTKV